MSTQRKLANRSEMSSTAHALLALTPELIFYPQEDLKADRVSLYTTTVDKPNRKGAQVTSEGVRFMVPDWSMEEEIRAKGFSTGQDSNMSGPRLWVLGVNTNSVQQHPELFAKLTRTAHQESEKRMAQPRAER